MKHHAFTAAEQHGPNGRGPLSSDEDSDAQMVVASFALNDDKMFSFAVVLSFLEIVLLPIYDLLVPIPFVSTSTDRAAALARRPIARLSTGDPILNAAIIVV